MGAAAGWRLRKRGAEVVCFDRYSPPHDLGSTHGESRVTRTAYIEGEWYVPLLQETFPMWRELEAESKEDLLTITGLLLIGPPEAEAVKASLSAAKMHGIDVKVLDEPTNNLDPPSRVGVARALASWPGTMVIVSHDAEFVDALKPGRVIFMPEGRVDYWDDELLDVVSMA